MDKVYTYTVKRARADGSIAEYRCNIKYHSKGKKKDLSEEEIENIRRRYNDGVTKKRICEDYGIGFGRLNTIIGV